MIVKHRYQKSESSGYSHNVDPDTKKLFIGTFNPETNNESDFYYGRPRNYFWSLLSNIYELDFDLKPASREEKIKFLRDNNLDVVDIINVIDVEDVKDLSDSYIDSKVVEWYDILKLIESLGELKDVYFTRSTFQGIPNIERRINIITKFCYSNGIRFHLLLTPSRFINQNKIKQWKDRIINYHK